MLYLQKGRFQKVIRWMGGSWMTANMATFFGIIFILLVSVGFYAGLTYPQFHFLLCLVPLFLILRMAMNALDGMLSRELGTGSVAGEVSNEALDIIGDTLSYGSLFFVAGGPRVSLVVFILLAWAAEFFGVLGKSMPGGVRRHETILGGKPDRATWMGLLALILFFKPAWLQYTPYFLAAVSVFVGLTSVIRIKKTIEAAKGKEYESYTWIGK